MVKPVTDILRNLLFAAALLLSAGGCVKESLSPAVPEVHEEPEPMSGDITLMLNLSFDETGGMTRAGADDAGGSDEPVRPGVNHGTALENIVNTIHLFFEDADENGSPAGGGRVMFRFDNVTAAGNELELKFDASRLTYGWKNVYVGANLSEEQARCFADGNTGYKVPDYLDALQYGLVEAYAPGLGIGLGRKNDNPAYARKDIAMFCEEKQMVYLTNTENEYWCDRPFILKRTVAKVLTTCKVDYEAEAEGRTVGYCALNGDLQYAEDYRNPELRGQDRGWMRQSSVRYLVNALNRMSFVMQKREWNAQEQKYDYEDPNYGNLDDYYDVGEGGGVVTPRPGTSFLYNGIQVLNRVSEHFVATLRHEGKRIPGNGSEEDSYYEGLYCPENTFTADDLSEDEKLVLSEYNYPWPMITHVSITSVFTPREIYVEKVMKEWIVEDTEVSDDMKARIVNLIEHGREVYYDKDRSIVVIEDCGSEEVAGAILTASVRKYYEIYKEPIYVHEKPGFPENTYLRVRNSYTDRMEFFTYGAALIIAKEHGWGTDHTGKPLPDPDKKKLLAFEAMPRGRGYYYTYIDNRRNSDPDKVSGVPATWENSQVERNIYYILTVNSFSSTGSSGSSPEFVKVHTDVSGWTNGGEAEFELN